MTGEDYLRTAIEIGNRKDKLYNYGSPIAIAAFVGDDPAEDPMRPSIFNEAPMMTGSIFLAYFGSILLSIGVMITTRFIDHRHSRKNP